MTCALQVHSAKDGDGGGNGRTKVIRHLQNGSGSSEQPPAKKRAAPFEARPDTPDPKLALLVALALTALMLTALLAALAWVLALLVGVVTAALLLTRLLLAALMLLSALVWTIRHYSVPFESYPAQK